MNRKQHLASWLVSAAALLAMLTGGCPTSTESLTGLPTTVAGTVSASANTLPVSGDQAVATNQDPLRSDDGEDEVECLELVLPVTYVLSDGSQLVIEGDFGWALLDAWYEVYDDEEEEPELQFPVEVVFDGETVIVENDDQLHELEVACYGEDEECLEPVLPIAFVLPDGSELVIASDEDFDLLEQWYEDNPDAEEEPQLQFPIEVLFDDEIITVEDDEQLGALEEACYGDEEHEECFELVLPVTFVLPDGTEIVVETDEDFDLLDQWYDENPDAEEEPQLQFPVQILIGDVLITVDDEEQLEDIEIDCDC